MASEIRDYVFTIPAGTLDTAPATLDVSFPARVVDTLEVMVPPGPNGNMGFALQNSGVQIIPVNDSWIIANGTTLVWPLNGYITSGSWQLSGYNTGAFDHTIYVRFLLELIAATPAGSAPAFLPVSQLAPAQLLPAIPALSAAGP